MKKYFIAVFLLISVVLKAQDILTVDHTIYEAHLYSLSKDTVNSTYDTSTNGISSQNFRIGKSGKYHHFAILSFDLVYSLRQNLGGSDITLTSKGDLEIPIIYSNGNPSSTVFQIVVLDQSILSQNYNVQWNAVNNASPVASQTINNTLVYDIRSLSNANNGKFVIGVKFASNNTPYSDCDYWVKAEGTMLKDVNINFTVENYFSDGTNGGKIKAQAHSQPTIESTSPASIDNVLTRKTVYAEAIDKTSDGYYVFNDTEQTTTNTKSKWSVYNQLDVEVIPNYSAYASINISTSSAINGFHYKAMMKRLYNATFTAPSGSLINAAGNTGSGSGYSSVTVQAVEGNSITASAASYSYNDVDYSFANWKISTTNYTSPLTPTNHTTYEAKFTAKPNVNNRSLANDSDPNENVVLIWNAHPNNNVTGYKVYRKVKSNGVVGPEEQIATLTGRTTTTYTDYAYIVTNNPNDDRLMYDVRPVYTDADNTAIESDPYYVTVTFGISNIKMNKDERVITQVKLIPESYSISNHPNPFNPATVINYQLPTEGFVTIKVYDMLGKEIAELVNENKAAGYYLVNFDASKLASGIYIYSINAGSFNMSKKMILTK